MKYKNTTKLGTDPFTKKPFQFGKFMPGIRVHSCSFVVDSNCATGLARLAVPAAEFFLVYGVNRDSGTDIGSGDFRRQMSHLTDTPFE